MKVKCEHCDHVNVFSVEDLHGMPLRNQHGQIVSIPPVDVETGVLIVACDACGKPMIYDCEKK